MILFTGTLSNQPEANPVKQPTNIVCLNHWTDIKCIPDQVIELSNT